MARSKPLPSCSKCLYSCYEGYRAGCMIEFDPYAVSGRHIVRSGRDRVPACKFQKTGEENVND